MLPKSLFFILNHANPQIAFRVQNILFIYLIYIFADRVQYKEFFSKWFYFIIYEKMFNFIRLYLSQGYIIHTKGF